MSPHWGATEIKAGLKPIQGDKNNVLLCVAVDTVRKHECVLLTQAGIEHKI